jgi:hypothetical protein
MADNPKKGSDKNQEPKVKQGIKKGKPEALPRGAMPPATIDRCRNCVISALNGQAFPPGSTTGTTAVPENQAQLQITATPNPANCPCKWSNEVYVEYVGVLTGHATKLKRKNFQFPQVVELIKIDPRDPKNPYVTIAGCTITIQISQLNQDLRNGINTQHAFFRGVVTRLKLGVSCNKSYRTIYIDVTDK